MNISFLKMQAAGNDFVLIDELDKIFVSREEKPRFVVKVSDRHFGIGSDGVIFVQPSSEYDLSFVFYNPDGSPAEMCGNGMRCFIKYVFDHGIQKKKQIRVETKAGLIVAEPFVVDGVVEEVRVDMGSPSIKRKNIPVSGDPSGTFIDQGIEVGDAVYRVTAVGLGNPHAVLFTENLKEADVLGVGQRIRLNSGLFPKGVNVHFVQNMGDNVFGIRSYERGVEGETLACGTGICASAVALALNNLADKTKSMLFHAQGGNLRVDLEFEGEYIKKIFLTGPVEEVFRGELVF